ncbi:hypothetical protein [Agrobacterium sp. NPDC089420]|uniref:hypothetical protein n=1 Tax=Agrobacterium sp. NPDC089420 TaxID=3363918 RepID=UPI00384E60D8
MFLENSRDLGVKNGMLGTVENVEPGLLDIRLDKRAGGQTSDRVISLSTTDYEAVDDRYATTTFRCSR